MRASLVLFDVLIIGNPKVTKHTVGLELLSNGSIGKKGLPPMPRLQEVRPANKRQVLYLAGCRCHRRLLRRGNFLP